MVGANQDVFDDEGPLTAATAAASKGKAQAKTASSTTSIKKKPKAPGAKGASTKAQAAKESNQGTKGKGPLSAEEAKMMKEFLSRAKSNKQNINADEDKGMSIQDANTALLEIESSEESGDSSSEPPAKKKKKNYALDDDEQAIANGFQDDNEAQNDAASGEEVTNANGEDEGDEEDMEERPAPASKEDIMVDDEPVGGTTEDTFYETNGMEVQDVNAGKKRKFKLQAPRSSASSSNGKIVRNKFPSDIQILADASNSQVRMNSIIGNDIFPAEGEEGKTKWLWDAVLDAKKKHPNNPILQGAFQKVLNDEDVMADLLTYISYGRSQIMTTIITRARAKVVGHYTLTGKSSNIISKVDWLLDKAHFIYGDIDLQSKTWNRSKPFDNNIIKEIIQSIWFTTSGRGKCDIMTTQELVKTSSIPITMVLLVTTAVEHAISEYTKGKENANVFKDHAIRTRYRHFLGMWKGLISKSKSWSDFYPVSLYNALAYGIFSLDYDKAQTDVEDIDNVDGQELDRIVAEGLEVL
ncbi:hypothetical protein CPC08DRAFT_768538 [Agrocybe pediades]|nr:hypothetical protein CPC08DRAFT_768538 [Agrocybe pediades]